jgi:hypothetical protein
MPPGKLGRRARIREGHHEAVTPVDVQPGELARVGDRFGQRLQQPDVADPLMLGGVGCRTARTPAAHAADPAGSRSGLANVRRLEAVDMYGTAGARWRRCVIVVEFLAGVVLCATVGSILVASGGTTDRLIGWWLLTASVNYLPLALHGVWLLRPGALDTELAGVNIRAELRYYSLAQLWVAVPAAVVFALTQFRSPPERVESGTAPQERHD